MSWFQHIKLALLRRGHLDSWARARDFQILAQRATDEAEMAQRRAREWQLRFHSRSALEYQAESQRYRAQGYQVHARTLHDIAESHHRRAQGMPGSPHIDHSGSDGDD
jgi:hypothetical protein